MEAERQNQIAARRSYAQRELALRGYLDYRCQS